MLAPVPGVTGQAIQCRRRHMAEARDELARPRGEYGVDAPVVPITLAAVSSVLVILAAVLTLLGAAIWAMLPLAGAILAGVMCASYLYTTRLGKFAVWAQLLRQLRLQGDERLLDMGCGRGAVLLKAAQLVPSGGAVGIDLWKSADQSGNSIEVTRRNAELEGVAERVKLYTGDMTAMPFEDASFDVVLSSMAIHNIRDRRKRATAIDEAVRVLKPGGRLMIADIEASGQYLARLGEHGMREPRRSGLGWRFWYGGPWVAAALVTATKPG